MRILRALWLPYPTAPSSPTSSSELEPFAITICLKFQNRRLSSKRAKEYSSFLLQAMERRGRHVGDRRDVLKVEGLDRLQDDLGVGG